ncbi:NAD(P)-binding protein [Mycena galericulata]|nr:NAD(P)-binding protein [Mycena galericulata]
MTITQNLSAPLVAVVGATGNQGGSVIKALEESDKPYRIRGFTRDATKPVAQELSKKGVEVVTVSLVVGNDKKVYEAFDGANYTFLMTNFWEHFDKEKEFLQAKLQIDASKAAGATRVVWSGLTSMSKASGGKYVNVLHFDGKADASEYGRQSGVPFVDVQAGFYASNLFDTSMVISKQEDGSFALEWATDPASTFPVIDIAHDYGLYVRQVFELPVFPDGSEVLTAGENITAGDIAQQLSEVTGKKVVFKQISDGQFRAKIQALGRPQFIVDDLAESASAWSEFGYYGNKPTASLEGLARKPRTWKEFAQATDWGKILV